MKMFFTKIHIIIMTLSLNLNARLHSIVTEDHLFFVNSTVLRNELKDKLLCLSNIQDTFFLVHLESVGNFYLPLSCFLSNVPHHDWFFRLELYWHHSKVKFIWEFNHRYTAYCSDRYYEFFSFCDDHQIIGIVSLRLWRKSDNVGNFHSWGYSAVHVVNVSWSFKSFCSLT